MPNLTNLDFEEDFEDFFNPKLNNSFNLFGKTPILY